MATLQEQQNFIEHIAPIIRQVGSERGYKIVSPFIAMACKEGAFGKSSLAKKYHNHFGMKSGSSWKGQTVNLKTMEEYTVGKLTQITDGFRVYIDDVAGVNGFFDFISAKRYANVKVQSNSGTPLSVLQAIKSAGYCTSSTYVNSCMKDYIDKFNLTKYDSVSKVETPKAEVKETTVIEYPILKMGVTDANLGKDYVASWQRYFITLGMYNGNVDGIFGIKTYYSVRAYQRTKDLKADGIIGAKTWATLKE